MASTKKAAPEVLHTSVEAPAGPPLDYCFMEISDLKNLGSVQPVSGFTKSQVAAARKRAPVVGITASSTTETAVQPVQQDIQAPKPGHYKCNSFAIKLASNPVTSLAGLQDAVAAVLDAPLELRWLDLSQCKLGSIEEDVTRFPKLQMLYLHANQISKLSDVKKLAKLPELQKLTLHGNPIAELPNYKLHVMSCIPTLRELDFVAISKLDRDTANTWVKAQRNRQKA